MNRNRISLLVGGLLILAACDSNGGPDFTPFFMFTYAGATAGSFNATGVPPTTGTSANTWAAALRDTQDNSVTVLGVTAALSNLVGVTFPDGATGTLNIDAACAAGQACATFGLILGLQSNNSAAGFFCDLDTGTLTITKQTDTRVAGTFSGTGTCATGGGADAGALTVTAGSFEVTFVSNTQAPL